MKSHRNWSVLPKLTPLESDRQSHMHLVFLQPQFSAVKKHTKLSKHTSLLPASLMRLVPLGLTTLKPAQAVPDHGERPRAEAEV